MSLQMSVTCTLLAPAGPQRSRMLATLYKDERSHSLPNYSMLEKMFMERLLRREEVEDDVLGARAPARASVIWGRAAPWPTSVGLRAPPRRARPWSRPEGDLASLGVSLAFGA